MTAAQHRTRTFLFIGVVVALLIAGLGSYYASSSPDGLEATAAEQGFDTAQDSAVAGSPLADYGTAGIDDARLSGGLAGVVGVLLVLVLAGGLTLVLRRRNSTADDERADGSAADDERAPTAARG
ncbi:PDGLE domain-containing protein [Modestobacter roseus]|uniref:Cobalt/nickel transport system permease protein/cobalt/nickel transport protein n=1 Tax=Modestobacter roseus TaxID=1181884 RepID=A0A562IST2_9ACTN|nr:PDGLE domain-containing protein [Modestobacter roseus]TWH73900.1 cobalt/nickel transport system permease protein/cobalt/nickel transport protein [Modestobacter roseus]